MLELNVIDTLFRSPAWPVANRQTVCVRLVARHAATGRLRLAMRSVGSAASTGVMGSAGFVGVQSLPPAGFVRGTVAAAGYELRPTERSGGDACSIVYANVTH